MIKCGSISGGRTSAKMLRVLLDEGYDLIPMFCNTGKERNETLDFLHNIETLWNVPLVWLEYTRVPASHKIADIYPHPRSKQTVIEQMERGQLTHWFKVVDYTTAKRRTDEDIPFDELLRWANVLPNVRTRMCSVQLKVRTMMRFLFSQGIYEWTDNIGIRYDERDRSLEIMANCPSYRHCRFPLIDDRTTESDVMHFWKQQPFDLQLIPMDGNCDMCFLKAKHKRVDIARRDPQAVVWWEAQERRFAAKPEIEGDGKYFRKGEPYADIRYLAEHEQRLPLGEDIPCGCADKGFVVSEQINCEI